MTLFPATLKDAFTGWQVGTATIDDKPVQVLQGRSAGQPLPVNFYFDESGLLVRTVRCNRTPVGTVPTQKDFSDYHDVPGVTGREPHRKWLAETLGTGDGLPGKMVQAGGGESPDGTGGLDDCGDRGSSAP